MSELSAKDLARAFHLGLKERMTSWAMEERISPHEIGPLEVDVDDGVLVMIVNLADGRRRAFPFTIPQVH